MKQIIPVKQGDNITLTVNGLGSSGEGVGKYEGFTVFVKGALPEEEVRVTITLVKKSYAVGALEEIVKASAERVEPACPVYKECGGCQLQHLSYKGQLECKRQQVHGSLPVFRLNASAHHSPFISPFQKFSHKIPHFTPDQLFYIIFPVSCHPAYRKTQLLYFAAILPLICFF